MHVLGTLKWAIYRRRALRRFRAEFDTFRRMPESRPGRLRVHWEDRMACLDDRTKSSGFDRHYIYHTSWAARIVRELRPDRHVDISSLLYFSCLLSAFVPVDFYDYRPADVRLSNLSSSFADLTKLPFSDRSIMSISCMHTVEHIGLGRYGDTLDPDGDLKAMSELQRVVAPSGSLLFVVPVGRARVCFNGHRIYPYEQIIDAFPQLRLHQFALIPDRAEDGDLVVNASQSLVNRQEYGCGCFWLQRPAS